MAKGGIEPPTSGFSGCKLTFRLTGRVHVSPREAHKHTVRFTSGHATKPGADNGRQDRSARCREISRRELTDGSEIDQLIKRGELPPPIRIGRKQFWLRDKFTRWLHDGGTVRLLRTIALGTRGG
jgi:predicted DNA-binding transcriptional regulator AlpA